MLKIGDFFIGGYLMLSKISFLLVIFLMSCKTTSYKENFEYEDLQLSLEIFSEFQNISGEFKCKNISGRNIKIPKFYLSFYADEKQENILKNNWLEIKRQDGSELRYFGLYCDSSPSKFRHETFLLKKGDECKVYIKRLDCNYDFVPGETVFMRYYGPLGKSNFVKFVYNKNEILTATPPIN